MLWSEIIKIEKEKDYYCSLENFILNEYKNNLCFPKYEDIFNALEKTEFDNVKVVILGQDPYHEKGQAHGLSFSVLCEKLPPSLINIYREMETDLSVSVKQDGNLEYLASQGVLLLNTTLSVREGKANSHSKKGWEIFTDKLIKELNKKKEPIVFILWGKNAISKKELITNKIHLIIESSHPSPLSSYRGFFGSKPFSRTNEFLSLNNIKPINWVK